MPPRQPPTPDELEADIRRWAMLIARRYEDGSLWVTDPDWPKWKQIIFLIQRIDKLHDIIRDQELAADEQRPTEEYSAVPRPRPATSDDTIAFVWKPSVHSDALTPVKPFPTEPRDALPVAPSIPAPTQQLPALGIPSNADTGAWNTAIMQCEMAAETAMVQAILQKCHIYDLKQRVMAALKALRKVTQLEHFPSDDAYL